MGESGWKVLLLSFSFLFCLLFLSFLWYPCLEAFFFFSFFLYYEFNVVDIPLPCSLSVFSFSTYFLLYLPLDLFMSLDVCPFCVCLFVCFYSASSHSFTIHFPWCLLMPFGEGLSWAWLELGLSLADLLYISLLFSFCLWLCLFNYLSFLFSSMFVFYCIIRIQ